MRTPFLYLTFFLSALCLSAQTTESAWRMDFTTTRDKGGVRFVPQCTPLNTSVPGAPEPFYTYYWEFGDGDFSFEESPVHTYATAGEHMALLDATAHYDDNKKPPGSSRSIMADAREGGGGPISDVFDEDRQTVALKTNRKPRPDEELVCIISYRNTSSYITDGRLHLFYNEKKFPARHFDFKSARTHFGEVSEASYSEVETPMVIDWSRLSEGIANTGDASNLLMVAPPSPRTDLMLARAREAYRQEDTWRFTQLRPGETRNVFVTLGSTASMLKDTSAFIHLQGLLAPYDPAIPAGEFTLEIEIVSSHDPNAIAVSENRVNYRRLGKEKLDYKVQFQNNGEGPAKKVELTVSIPEGLNAARMRPLSWYPECPVCAEEVDAETKSCLDTATVDNSLVFTFRNIYLPGSKQEGVESYDSTKGFVRYRIQPFKDMPKRAFRSQAKIVFDKNKPIYTNFSKTKFKKGLSPGLKAGYAFMPDSSGSGYVFMGGSLSPYKSWKIYPQVELLTGLKGQTDLPELVSNDTITPIFLGDKYNDTLTQTVIGGSRGFVSFEVPVLLRKNFNKYFGMGLGGSARIVLANGNDTRIVNTTIIPYELDPMGVFFVAGDPIVLGQTENSNISYNSTDVYFSVFADLTLGLVRAGPNIGARLGGVFQDGFQPFVQLSVELKL